MFGITTSDVIKGILMYFIIRGIIWLIMRVLYRTERTIAILAHYQQRAEGQGHDPKDILLCNDGHCLVLQNSV